MIEILIGFIIFIVCSMICFIIYLHHQNACKHQYETTRVTTVKSEFGFDYYLHELKCKKCGDVSSRRIK